MKTLKQSLSRYGFKADSFSEIHKFAYGILTDGEASTKDRDAAGRLILTLAKELVSMERQIIKPAPAAAPASQEVANKAANLKLADFRLKQQTYGTG